ncbi:PREDICTED: putative F-box/LRR-repeat protein At5g02700 [Camelina sativa]|uniref:F-box/LRR-repeat protein At5g02700 n=1 Tax=Camelina sativa TaxID=90675 RepID=A0ABM0XTA2_CAMSA|nr:PREDICTED: putative F-box/LRR-repeat protein At5g02700 [Camelina sativa]
MANRRGRRRRRKRGKNHSHCRIKHGADFINSMPDEILHHILSFIPTELAMTTCVLSRRWRHVWCETPCLDIDDKRHKDKACRSINHTLTSYTAPKINSFNLLLRLLHNTSPEVDSWIEFAISRNVAKLSVSIVDFTYSKTYSFPDIFYLSSSLKQLTVKLSNFDMIPRCIVSWKSLRTLSLFYCRLPDESIDNILSGCPILESLKLVRCSSLERLDLSKSPSLRRLEINCPKGPVVIVAPHIHYLKLEYFDRSSTLVNVTSLAEADLKIISVILHPSNADLYQTMALEMVAKSHNVERLTLGGTLFQILSLAEVRGAPFPTLKVQTLTVKTELVRSIIPGILRLLQNSPGLKKLTLHTMPCYNIMDMHHLKGLIPDQYRWRSTCEVFPTSKEIYKMFGCNDATSKLLASFIELVVRNAKTLERMVIWLEGSYFNDAQWFEEMLQMVETISHNNNVSIVLKRSNC